MKAAVAREFGKPLVIEEIDIAPPQAGIIDEVGPDVHGFRVGQHVVTLIRACHHYFCARGQPVFCETTFRLDQESPLTAHDGTPR